MAENHSPALGAVHSYETFGSADGPGVRFIVFLQGCAMRCAYCHNADTWKMTEGSVRAQDVLTRALRYKSYWKNGGGLTVSGGEPLLQMDFVLELFRLAKEKGIHTTLDTSGQPFSRNPQFLQKMDELMEVCDLVMLDIKDINDSNHRKLTAHSNQNILDFARYLDEIHKPVWIRHVLVPGLTDHPEDLHDLRKFVNSLSNVERVEFLPFHTLGMAKWEKLHMVSPLANVRPATDQDIEEAWRIYNH